MNKTQKINRVILARRGEFDPAETMLRLREIFEAAGLSPTMENFATIAADLSRVAGLSDPWTAKYVQSVYKGYKGCAASPAFGRAVDLYSEMVDGSSIDRVGLVRVVVLAREGLIPDGTFVPRTAVVRLCKRPGCNVSFIRTSPGQEYHDSECRELWAKERKEISRK